MWQVTDDTQWQNLSTICRKKSFQIVIDRVGSGANNIGYGTILHCGQTIMGVYWSDLLCQVALNQKWTAPLQFNCFRLNLQSNSRISCYLLLHRFCQSLRLDVSNGLRGESIGVILSHLVMMTLTLAELQVSWQKVNRFTIMLHTLYMSCFDRSKWTFGLVLLL